MSLARLKIGESLPLRLNAWDGNTTLFPQVILRDASDTLIGIFDLIHVGEGMYKNDGQSFPSTTLVTAVYKTYSDASHSTLDPNYQDMIDVFLQADAIVSPNSISIVERIEANFRQNIRMTAVVFNNKIVEKIKTNRLLVKLNQTKIVGTIKQQKITAIVQECL